MADEFTDPQVRRGSLGKVLPSPNNRRAIVLLSGGLDSATAAAQAIEDGYTVTALSCRYGQRHIRELQSARALAENFGIQRHFIVDVDLSLWGGSALTDLDRPVPKQGVDVHQIPSTYVPGRNTIFIALALSLAETEGAEAVYLGINAVDYSGYPDCRPTYLDAFQNLAELSSKAGLEGNAPKLVAPLIQSSKVEIVRKALSLNVPIDLTWSCYQGGEEACGLCDSCRIRDDALILSGHPELASKVAQQKYGKLGM